MPKQIAQAELDVIVDTVTSLPDGGSVDRVAEALGKTMPKRTLQRRLAALVQQGRLVQEGRGPGTMYRSAAAPPTPPAATERDQAKSPADAFEDRLQLRDEFHFIIPISEKAEAVRRLIRAPVQERPPVGYNRAFLDDYVPGSTWYLPEDLRRRLLDMGRTADRNGTGGTYASRIYQRLLIDLSWNSSRLEGNTYSLLETDRLLKLGESATGKDAEETQMILNHKAAIDLLVEGAEHLGFNRYTVLNLHAVLADNLLPDPGAAGRLRSEPVGIGNSLYHPPELPQLIDECFDLVLKKAAAIPHPIEQAFFLLVQIPYLQPFVDVNKRVSRLAANLPLVRNGLCPLSFVDMPQRQYVDGLLGIYERNRTELLRDVFCWAYERSCLRYSAARQSLGEPDRFRLRHRDIVIQTIREIVLARMDKAAAAAHVRDCAEQMLRQAERHRFAEVVETDLLNLHEGNVAKARLSPRQFEAWQTEWR